jgi:EmrB/QacA subfamily drug resistance transporter
MVAPALGPILSGYLLQYADWRLIFLINLPVGVLALLIGLRVLPAIPAGRVAGALDAAGIVLGPLAFASISFGVSQSTVAGWGALSTLSGIALGLGALALFIWRELTSADPVLDLRVFRHRDFALGILAQWAATAAMFGTFFLVPLFLQRVRGYGALETGIYTLPTALASAVFMQIGGRVFDRVGVRPPVLVGMSLIGLAMWFLSGLRGDTSGEDLRLPLALLGAGMGSMMMALNTHLLNSAPRELVGRVTSLTSSLQNVVASLAIATFATLLQGRIALHAAESTQTNIVDATAFAFGDVYRVALVIIALGWCLVWTLRRGQATQPAEVEHFQPSAVESAA